MLSIVKSMALYGLDGCLINVQVDVAKGMPRMGDSWVTRYKYKRVKRKSKNSNKKLRIWIEK